jgi:hypothetical protein
MMQKVTIGGFVIVALGVTVGCNQHIPGVKVLREADHYVVLVRDCTDPQWRMPVWEIKVGRSPPGVHEVALCELDMSLGSGGEGPDSMAPISYGSRGLVQTPAA